MKTRSKAKAVIKMTLVLIKTLLELIMCGGVYLICQLFLKCLNILSKNDNSYSAETSSSEHYSYRNPIEEESSLTDLLEDKKFTKHHYMDFVVDDIKFRLDYWEHEDFEEFHHKEFFESIEAVTHIVSNELSEEIKALLRHKASIIHLRDIKHIRKYCNSISTIGYYMSSDYDLHVGICGAEDTRETFIHELGHFIDHVIVDKMSDEIYFYSEIHIETYKCFEKEKYEFREYARKNLKEYIAVAYESYFQDVDSMSKTAPLTKKLLDHYMELINTIVYDNELISDELIIDEYVLYEDYELDEDFELCACSCN